MSSVAVAQALAASVSHETATDHPDKDALWRPVIGLPCQLTVDLPLPNFRVRDFVGLRPGSVIRSAWGVARDVPLRINGTLIGWGELDVAGSRLAVRCTELA